MLIYESMHSLLVLYYYIGSHVIQNTVAKTGSKVAKTGISTLLQQTKIYHTIQSYIPIRGLNLGPAILCWDRQVSYLTT